MILRQEAYDIPGLDLEETGFLSLVLFYHEHDGCYANGPHFANKLRTSKRTISRIKSDMISRRFIVQKGKYLVPCLDAILAANKDNLTPNSANLSTTAKDANLALKDDRLTSKDANLAPEPRQIGVHIKNKDTTKKEKERIPAPKKERPRDLLFDAIAEVCELDPKSCGSGIAEVAKCLRDNYSPEDVLHIPVLLSRDSYWAGRSIGIGVVKSKILAAKNDRLGRSRRVEPASVSKSFSDKGIHEYEPSAHQQDFVPPVEEKVGF